MTSAALTMDLQTSLQVPTFKLLGIYWKIKLLEYVVILCLIFEEPPYVLFAIVGIPFYVSTNSGQGLQFLHILLFDSLHNYRLYAYITGFFFCLYFKWSWFRPSAGGEGKSLLYHCPSSGSLRHSLVCARWHSLCILTSSSFISVFRVWISLIYKYSSWLD